MFNIAEGFVALRGEDLLWSLSCLGGDQFVCIVKWYVKLAGQFFSYGSFSAVGVAAEGKWVLSVLWAFFKDPPVGIKNYFEVVYSKNDTMFQERIQGI